MTKSLGRAAASVLAAVALLSACAINPYVGDVRPPRPATTAAPGTMAYAQQYADNLHGAYYGKLNEEFLREQRLSGGLLTLAAAGLLAATGHAHSDVLIGMAVGGGLAYQLGTWNTSRSRHDIYLEGMKAVSCAKAAIAPLNLQPAQIDAIRRRADSTRDAMDRASQAAGQLAAWRLGARDDVLRQIASEELADTQKAFRQATEVVARAASLEGDVNQAGNFLELQLNKVEDSVTGAINGTLADLRNLPAVIGDIAGYASMFQPGLQIEAARNGGLARAQRGSGTTAESGTLQRDAAERLPAAYEELYAARLQMLVRAEELSRSLATVTPDQLKASLANCGVDPSKISGTLRLGSSSVTLQPGGQASVGVFGGTPPYSVDPVGVLANGLTIRRDPPASVVVSATTTAVIGTQRVTVRDSTNAEVALTVDVQPATPDPRNAGTGAGTGTGTASTAESAQCIHPTNMAREEICFLQKAVGATVDGRFGKETCSRLQATLDTRRVNDQVIARLAQAEGLQPRPTVQDYRQFLQQHKLLAACHVPAPAAGAPTAGRAESQPGCVAVADPGRCRVAGARCEFECGQSADQLRNVGRSLGLNPLPENFADSSLRHALAAFQKQKGLANTFGDYTQQTADALPPPR